jgi:putative hemolysin
MLLMSNVHKRLGEVRFLVNDVLMNIPQLRPIFVPINKHGGLSRDLLQTLHDAYSSDVQILIFPSGFASRKIKGEIRDFTWQKHFVVKAIEYQRDVVPVHISGRNSNFFYNLANFRTRFRIKWNLEMFFLPDELFKQKTKNSPLRLANQFPGKHSINPKHPTNGLRMLKILFTVCP